MPNKLLLHILVVKMFGQLIVVVDVVFFFSYVVLDLELNVGVESSRPLPPCQVILLKLSLSVFSS